MKFKILTLFPEYFESILKTSILGKAVEQEQIDIELINIRDFASDKHKVTDERPFGGGAGMVMKIEPIHLALQSIGYDYLKNSKKNKAKVVLTAAKGRQFTQETAREYSKLEEIVIICGHYEGVDERVAKHLIDEEIRVGEYVLTGGEPAAAIILDSVSRLLDGVLGNAESLSNESHDIPGKLTAPCYTRPANYMGLEVPEVLLSGNHQDIEEWKQQNQKNEKK